jgi:hypothetical protein
MNGSGLAGVMGGIHLQVLKSGFYDVLFPLPQLADCQVPVYYCLGVTPDQALAECRLQERDTGNVFVNVKLNGTRGQEIMIEWSGVVLIAANPLAENRTQPERYRSATACVQCNDQQVKELASRLWPATGKARDYATSIQKFIRNMKRKEQPRSLDALGILKSGENMICTADANLACALMRSRQIPCRSMAVIPPTSQRLEMHRIVEYFADGKWVPFDPTQLHVDIPLKPWQNILMARTTVEDEQRAMQPRVSSMPGCPFAQEAEISQPGLILFGNDFFWTIALPLAEFEVSEEATRLTIEEWKRYLQSGMPSAAQSKAASARNLTQYLEALKTR